jgi:hypothetical protein
LKLGHDTEGGEVVEGPRYYLAQVNIARMRAPLDDPLMQGFVARLDEINALADGSPGFVWRLQEPDGNATSIRAFDDDTIIVNMSVWESLDQLKSYVYRTDHGQVMRQRREWFEKFEGMYFALWWLPAGTTPTPAEARERLEHLARHGETPHAFTFRRPFGPPTE